MNLYILRHALAEDKLAWIGKADRDRPLTPEGIRKMNKIAQGMKALDLEFDWILTSPYRRAYDTAQLVAKTFKQRKRLRILKSLSADGNPHQLMRHLALDHLAGESLLLVGHEPYLSRLISVLIGSQNPLAMDFKKGGLCKLTAASLTYGSCATLEWWLSPKILRKLG